MVHITKDSKFFFESARFPIFIYGCTVLGKHLADLMARCGLQVGGFIDRSRTALGKSFWGVRVITKEEMIKLYSVDVYNIIITVTDINSVLLDFWNMETENNYNMLVPKQFDNGNFNSNVLLAPLRNRLLKNKNITIVSNNCSDRLIYDAIEIPINQRPPFCLAGLCEEDFVKLAEKFSYYAGKMPEYDRTEYRGLTIRKDAVYPVGKLDDIFMHFVHEDEWESVLRKWIKMRENINENNVFYIFSDFQRPIKYVTLKKFSDLPVNRCILLSKTMYCLPGVNYTAPEMDFLFDGSFIIEEVLDLIGWLNGQYEFA